MFCYSMVKLQEEKCKGYDKIGLGGKGLDAKDQRTVMIPLALYLSWCCNSFLLLQSKLAFNLVYDLRATIKEENPGIIIFFVR